MLLAVMAFALLTLAVFPEAPTSRFLHRLLIAPVARWMDGLKTAHLAIVTVAILGGVAMALLFGAEGLRLYSMVATEGMIWLAMVDVTILIDLLVVGTAVAATARVRAARDQVMKHFSVLGARVAGLLRGARRRARRLRPVAPVRTRRKDDPDPFGLAYAG